MSNDPQGRTQTRYVDRAEVPEHFVDHIEGVMVSDGCARILLSAARWPARHEQETAAPLDRVTVSRLVMPLKTAVELHNSLSQMMARLEQTGIVKGPRDQTK